MRIRLLLAAAVASSALAPLAPANATACNDQMFPEVCATFTAVCQVRPVGTVCRMFE